MLLPEIDTVGIYNSQIAMKNTAVSRSRMTSMFEIELPTEYGGISYIEAESTAITPNTIICAKPGQARHTKFPLKCIYLHMSVNDGLLYDTLLEIPSFVKITSTEKYTELFKRLYKYYSADGKYKEIMLQSAVLELIYTLKSEAPRLSTVKMSDTDRAIRRATEYIKGNINEKLSLERVAAVAALSPIYFHNRFKLATGKTLHEYVEEQRLKKAIELMLTSDLNITEIAYECGFSSQSYFNYVFKRKMNTTPRKYVLSANERYEK